MSNATGATLYNYAVGGSENAADLSPGRYTASQEVDHFRTELGSAVVLGASTLVLVWTGINKVKDIHSTFLATDRDNAWEAALAEVALNAQALLGQANEVIAAVADRSNVTYIIMSIPRLETIPQLLYGPHNSTQDLLALRDLTLRYNEALFNGVSRLLTVTA
jgi:hypothetical protein